MLLNQETKDKFGYSIESLSQGSNKKICLRCDYCQGVYESIYKQYNKAHDVIDKDACIKCKYQKRKDISLKLYGVENSAQRPDVRKKISEKCEGFDDKRKKTMIKRYGTSNPMLNDDLKRRQQQSVQDKYGVENVSQLPEVKEKREQTNLHKFGHKQFLASEEGKQKKTDGMMAKYGVINAFQSEEVKQKIRQTNLQNLGVEMPTQSKDVMAKIEQTNLEKYGVKTAAQNEEVKAKIVETNIKRYGYKSPQQSPEIKEKIRQEAIRTGRLKLYNHKDSKTLAKELEIPYTTFRYHCRQYGIEMATKMTPQISALEQVVKNWLDQESIKYILHFGVDGKRSDFLLTDYNIILELDGLFWHSDRCRPDSYHIDKHKLYTDNGYTSFFFRENEINNKFDIVKSIILNKMGRSNRIFARKCNIIKVDRKISQTFFEQNHLMGKGRGVTYGLTYNNELILCIIIRKVNGARYEISRFCPKRGYQVVGGLSRLITYFLRDNSIDSLTTFIDRRYGSGEYLTKLGFKFINCSPSFVWTDSQETFHRLRFRSNSGYEHGLVKLWDCGQARYDLCVKP